MLYNCTQKLQANAAHLINDNNFYTSPYLATHVPYYRTKQSLSDPGIPGFPSMGPDANRAIQGNVAMQMTASGAIWWPNLQPIQVAPSSGQIWEIWDSNLNFPLYWISTCIVAGEITQVEKQYSGSFAPLADWLYVQTHIYLFFSFREYVPRTGGAFLGLHRLEFPTIYISWYVYNHFIYHIIYHQNLAVNRISFYTKDILENCPDIKFSISWICTYKSLTGWVSHRCRLTDPFKCPLRNIAFASIEHCIPLLLLNNLRKPKAGWRHLRGV